MIPTEEHNSNPTYLYASVFIDELQRAGIHHVVICPGSRSTPLAMACADHPAIRTWLHIDERSAAFFGLGMAKGLNQPVALLCTSGTAAANFLPALVEAKLTHIPLLVLTADRPHELRECGAPQTIDQHRLYGSHVKWFLDVALPEANNTALRYIRTIANRATALTQALPAGPVHLNMPFREPLTPDPLPDQPLPPLTKRATLAWTGRPANAPYVTVSEASAGTIATERCTALAQLLRSTPNGLIIAGPYPNAALAGPLVALAQLLGYPILADPLSQLRCGAMDHRQIIASYDAFLRDSTFAERMVPQLILRFGAMPTAKPVLLYLQRYSECSQIVIDGNGDWNEPTQLAEQVIHADPVALCRQLVRAPIKDAPTMDEYPRDTPTSSAARIEPDRTGIRPYRAPIKDAPTMDEPPRDTSPGSAAQTAWLAAWQEADACTRSALYAAMEEFKPFFEGRIFSELATLLPDNATLYVGNSMPVRDLDTFFWCSQRTLRILGNRGANGIDGVISSALGVSAATVAIGQKAPTVLVIGDLSFFHDLNGLLAAHLHKLDLTIILVNNDGGGIFSFLPQAAHPTHFEQLFGTPTGLDFAPFVQGYGGTFQRCENWHEFRHAVQHSIDTGGLNVVEVRTERNSNVTMHRHLWQVVHQTLGMALFRDIS